MGLRRKLSYSEMMDYIDKNKALFKKLFLADNMTAKKVAENQNIEFDQNFSKALMRSLGKKTDGHGGARVGSGNKKGTKFCPTCGKKWTAGHTC